MVAKELDGAGGYDPGKLIKSNVYSMSKESYKSLWMQIEKIGFWNMPTSKQELGCDGARWILEGYKGEKYHIVDRWSSPKSSFHELGKHIMRLAKILPKEDIY